MSPTNGVVFKTSPNRLEFPQEQIIVSHALRQIQDLTALQAQHFYLLPCSKTEAEIFR